MKQNLPMMWVSLGLLFAINVAITSAYEITGSRQCFDPPMTGNCRAKIPMWFFNSTSSKCESFIYGGCDGNENRFSSREECISLCQPEICFHQPEVGMCKAAIPLWYYDSDHHLCEEFTYGGCGGNENKFGTEQLCQLACGGANEICPLSDEFETIGWEALTADPMYEEFFFLACESRCNALCVESHEWGSCLSFSLERTPYGCYCYLFDRHLSEPEFDLSTQGQSLNRKCLED